MKQHSSVCEKYTWLTAIVMIRWGQIGQNKDKFDFFLRVHMSYSYMLNWTFLHTKYQGYLVSHLFIKLISNALYNTEGPYPIICEALPSLSSPPIYGTSAYILGIDGTSSHVILNHQHIYYKVMNWLRSSKLFF